jgi:alpha-galactosidase
MAGPVRLSMSAGLPLVDVVTVGEGHIVSSDRLAHTVIGHEARYAYHAESAGDGVRTLELTSCHQPTGLRLTGRFTLFDGIAALRAEVTVTNDGARPAVLRSVTSLELHLGGAVDGVVYHGRNDWLGEGRWTAEPACDKLFPQLVTQPSDQAPRGVFRVASSGSWSTGRNLPVGGAASERLGAAAAWQVETNGAWRWEVGEDAAGGYVALSGPTDIDHQWTTVLRPGESFTTVPAAFSLAGDFPSAIGELTEYRRRVRRAHPDNATMGVVFNDYMNTLNGDPTTAKLLPLVDAAARVGAEIFCVDAGWYDSGGTWWDSVGEWRPSPTRFPGGLGEVIEAIRGAGMVPGLWLEPEVIGVESPIADKMADDMFLRRHGQRVVEHGRYHLDMRHPGVRAHLDGVVDRLVADLRLGYLKLDYNIDPGAGTDDEADSVGAGLLDHNRAHLAWLDGVLDRHPGLILENCASGGMRADFAMLARLQLQSTSDQQDFLLYPPIAAAAPLLMLPEQAANWAYPQPGMTDEQTAFCLATSLLGRFYLSGHLDRMDVAGRALVVEATSTAKRLRPLVRASVPLWPLGLPGWRDPWVALGLDTGGDVLVTLWCRGAREPATLAVPQFAGGPLAVETLFPRHLPAWPTTWDASAALLSVAPAPGTVGARVFRLAGGRPQQPATHNQQHISEGRKSQ